MKLRKISLRKNRTPEPPLTVDEWVEGVLEAIRTPLVIRALQETKK